MPPAVRSSLSVAALWLLVPCGCERITHASEFEVHSAVPFHGVCNECPNTGSDLRRPPCPRPSDAPDLDEMFVYLFQEYRLGYDKDQWTGATAGAFNLGVDLDCSDRPHGGRPALCEPRALADGSTGEPWVALPHGIDNAFAQRLFAPLYDKAVSLGSDVNLQAGINEQIAQGKGGVMIVVEGWNGTFDDPRVTARIVAAAGISAANGGPPRWDGHDLWDALSDGPDSASRFGAPNTAFKSDDAYVADGVLVLDLGFLGVADTTVVNNGARLDMPIHDFLIIGDLRIEELRNISVSGRWAYSDMVRSNADVASFLSGCEPVARAFVMSVWPDLVDVAPDLPIGHQATPGEPCEAISIGYGAHGARGRIGDYRPVSALPGGCPSQ